MPSRDRKTCRGALTERRGIFSEEAVEALYLLLAVVGLAIGLPPAMAVSKLVATFLFATKPNDPLTIAIGVAILLSAALLAGYAPARRASRIDPLVALRHD